MSAHEKKYGLIFGTSQISKTQVLKPSEAFSSSDSDENAPEDFGRPTINIHSMPQKDYAPKTTSTKELLDQQSNTYSYDDELYEKMDDETKTSDPKISQKRASKYVDRIQKMAKIREKESLYRQDRKYQKEREMEGGIYDGKDSYVTPSYKAYLTEKNRDETLEKERKKQDERNEIGKQSDMSLFYKHLFDDRTEADLSDISREFRKHQNKISDNSNIVKTDSKLQPLHDKRSEPEVVAFTKSRGLQTATPQTTDNSKRTDAVKTSVSIYNKRSTPDVIALARERYLNRKQTKFQNSN